MWSRLMYSGICALVLSAGLGCVETPPPPPPGESAHGMVELPEYPPLERYKLELNLEGERQLTVGSGGKLTFSLANVDEVPIRLVEWYANESDNLLIYCQPWLPGQEAPDEEMWIALSFDIVRPAPRYALELKPNNSVLISRKLPFIDKLKISPGAERRYFLKAALNLDSVKVESPLIAIKVRPPEEEPEKEKDTKEDAVRTEAPKAPAPAR